MSTAIISLEGGWFAREAALGLTYAENHREVGKNVYLPKSNRLLARLDSNKFLNDEEKARLPEVANQVLHLIAMSHQMAAKLDASDGDAANTQLHFHYSSRSGQQTSR